jgi:hypothetical protein
MLTSDMRYGLASVPPPLLRYGDEENELPPSKIKFEEASSSPL